MTLVTTWFPDPPPLPFGIIAEAPADHEASAAYVAEQRNERCPGPLVGPSGWRHEKVLEAVAVQLGVSLDRRHILHTNVFTEQMPTVNTNGAIKKNQFGPWLCSRDEHAAEVGAWRSENRRDPVAGRWVVQLESVIACQIQRRWLKRAYWHHLVRLWEEIAASGIKHFVTYGATAYWAMTGRNDFDQALHHLQDSTVVPGVTILPTFHPAHTFHKETLLDDVRNDVAKLASKALDIVTPVDEPIVWVPETPDELRRLIAEFITDHPRVAWDAEWGFPAVASEPTPPPVPGTRESLVLTSIQLCADYINAIYVPFFWPAAGGGSWWASANDHRVVVDILQQLNDNEQVNVWQNGINSDAYVLLEELDLLIRVDDDTLLQSHALSPGASKSLTDLFGRWCIGSPWKYQRKRIKRDE